MTKTWIVRAGFVLGGLAAITVAQSEPHQGYILAALVFTAMLNERLHDLARALRRD